ncbi:MAG: hypothetical protein G3I10_04995 [Ferrovum sp.]|nr:hypothetical protein [Ferrovum sp.]
MSILNKTLLGLLLTAAVQSPVWAGNWDKYVAIYNRFYLLDQQPIGSVTCSVDVPELDKWMQVVRAQAAQIDGSLVVSDTLSNYKITYSPAKGLTINDPALTITSLSDSSSDNKGKLSQTIIHTNETAFATLVRELDSGLRSLFMALQAPKPGNIDIYYLDESHGVYTVSYGLGGAQVTAIFNPDSTEMKVSAGTSVQKIHLTYDKMPDGKLLLIGSDDEQKGPFGTSSITDTMKYQMLANVGFPAQLVAHIKLTGIDTEQTSQLTITINSCKLH